MTENDKPSVLLKMIHYGAVLMAVCLASGAGLSLLYTRNKSKIEQNEMEVRRSALNKAMGKAKLLQEEQLSRWAENEEIVFSARTPDGSGRYVTQGSAQGYQSIVRVLVAVDAPSPGAPTAENPTIQRLVVLSSQETPGLGERINEVQKDVSLWGAIARSFSGEKAGSERRPAFQKRFSGKKLSDLKVSKSESDAGIMPITGATITSTAVTTAARRAAERIVKQSRKSGAATGSPQ
jgi:RnfABCDGE-type electron transport complex G subunit